MDATIAICTWNRAALLDQTLTRMQRLAVPDDLTWEIVVVNNNCTDDTSDVIARHASNLTLREVIEHQQGQSHARNAAAAAARGELILWTDDDVLVDPQWLAGLVSAVKEHPDAAFFGGPIHPWFEKGPPAWLTSNWPQFASAYAVRDLGPEPIECDCRRLPFGANYAIRREVQLRYRYDGRLGRVGHGEVRGEESELLGRMIADGHRGRWVPGAKVEHFIPAERLTLDYLRGVFRGVGQAEVIRQPALARSRTQLALSSLVSRAWLTTIESLPARRGPHWARALIRSSVREGRVAAALRVEKTLGRRLRDQREN